MLQYTFQHISGIGPKIEKRLWTAGIKTWQDIHKFARPNNIPLNCWNKLRKELPTIVHSFATKNIELLNLLVPSELQWRMIPNYFDEIAYLDIETTGGFGFDNYITTIAVYDGQKIHNFTRGINLDEFSPFIQQFPVICTFFGKGFDIPFIKHEMGIEFPQIHLDVCFLLRKVGLQGGLKRIEKRLGISRGDIEGIYGDLAVVLWSKYLRTKDPRYLNTLIAYNSEDVVNLEYLLVYAYNALSKKVQLPVKPLELQQKTIIRPYHADQQVIRELFKYEHIRAD